MLGVIAVDLDEPQTSSEQRDKAAGKSDASERAAPTAAQAHGAGRAESGFTVEQMVAEFRALRASVIRLWTKQLGDTCITELEDLTRFNEAIDQAIAESISRFTQEIGQSKERFLAILGHDLRTPLGAIITSSAFMLEKGDIPEPNLTLVSGIASSARRMNQMVSDLLDFTRTRFGDTIPVETAPMDLSGLIQQVVSEVGASTPDSHLHIESRGDLRGEWDAGRLTQAITNLIANAVQHGDPGYPINIVAKGEADEVVISVQNHGPVIPEDRFGAIFEAMKHGTVDGARDRRHLGLGLYIVEKIVTAHKGEIDVTSTEDQGTTFTVRLPRKV
jgi:signal transduction histidine kinase